MNAVASPPRSPRFRAEAMRIGGERVTTGREIEILNPWSGEVVGTVPRAGVEDVRRAAPPRHPLRAAGHPRHRLSPARRLTAVAGVAGRRVA